MFHLAAQAGVRKSWGKDFQTYTVNNIDATQALLEACVGRPLERVVYASSSSVYGDRVAIPMAENRQLKADIWDEYQKMVTDAGTADGRQGKQERVTSSFLKQRRG